MAASNKSHYEAIEPEAVGHDAVEPYRTLLVADEWFSGSGGISTVNRGLASGLAAIGCEVAVMVPEATDEEVNDAQALGVTLVSPDPIPGLAGKPLLLKRPRFDDPNWKPDLIVGHGRILGPYAFSLRNEHFQQAKRAHVVHMDPTRLEKAKESTSTGSRSDAATERHQAEVELAVSAHVVAGIGSTLHEYISDGLRGRVNPRPPIIKLLPGLKEWEQTVDPDDPPVRQKILLLARADDIRSKGIDLAVRAVKQAVLMATADSLERPTLVVRGVPAGSKDEVQARLNELALPDLEVYLQPFSTSERDLLADMLSSRLVLMPSRHEGFGLAALEAMAAGVPVRITAESGLARLLCELPADGARPLPREILRVMGEPTTVEESWGRSIQEVLDDPAAAYRRAASVREELATRLSWAKTARLLVATAKAAPKPPNV